MPFLYAASSAREELGNAPQDIKRNRRKVLDYLNRLGQPAVWKHKWTEEDVEKGRAQHCPYCRNVAYRQPTQNDPYCFGTGFLGGFDDGVLVWVTLGDTQQDVFKLTREGVLIRDNHPICQAPWNPTMSDGDLLLTVALADDLWSITEVGTRYIVNETTPVNPRGSRSNPANAVLYPISQTFQVDQLQPNHPFAATPILFNSSNLPIAPTIAPGADPDNNIFNTSIYDISVTIHGLIKPVDYQRVTVSFD